MFKNYFKIAIRNLAKQKRLSFISVFGLAVGIACFSLCALYALNEFSIDSFHKNAYRINMGWWVFAMTGLAIICTALLTISFQAIKAAIANPVKSLRTE